MRWAAVVAAWSCIGACALFARAPEAPADEARIRAATDDELSLTRFMQGDVAPGAVRGWRQAVDAGATDARRVQRAEWVTGLLVAARIDAVAEPELSARALAYVEALTGCSVGPGEVGCVRRKLASDLVGRPSAQPWTELAEWAWGDPTLVDVSVWAPESPEARAADLVAAAHARDWFGARRSHPLDAPPFLDALTRYRAPVASVPEALEWMHTRCSADQAGPWEEALGERAAGVCRAVVEASIPSPMTPTDLIDVTLQVPRAFDDAEASTAWPFERALVVRSTGVWLRTQQHWVWRDGGASLDPPEAAEELLTFEGPGMVAVDDLIADRLPALEEGLRTRRTGRSTALSLIVDGNTYFATLRPILWAAADAGYEPIVLHFVSDDGSRFASAPVALVPESTAVQATVRVRQDGYLVAGASEDAMVAPHSISRVGDAPLLELVRYVETLVDSEADDVQLTVVVEDGTADVGILSHVLSSLAWRRDTALLYDDLGLLRAAPIVRGGVPARLAPGGVRLAY